MLKKQWVTTSSQGPQTKAALRCSWRATEAFYKATFAGSLAGVDRSKRMDTSSTNLMASRYTKAQTAETTLLITIVYCEAEALPSALNASGETFIQRYAENMSITILMTKIVKDIIQIWRPKRSTFRRRKRITENMGDNNPSKDEPTFMLFPHPQLALFDVGSFHVDLTPALDPDHRGTRYELRNFAIRPLSPPLSRSAAHRAVDLIAA